MTNFNLIEEYKGIFVEQTKEKLGKTNFILDNIQSAQEIIGKTFLEWDQKEDIALYLSLFGASSPRSLYFYFAVLKRFAEFVSEEIGQLPPKYKMPNLQDENILNYNNLAKKTLTYQQYIHIKNQLTILKNGVEANIRDKVIFELAWAGLTNEEIKLLKEENITFIYNELGLEVAILEMKNRVQRIEDLELIDDIKKCMKEKFYYVETKSGVMKKMSYREVPYLIKPVKIGIPKKEGYLNNPGLALQKTFRGQGIICEGIDMDYLSLEDVRRSKLIYLLAPQNEKYFDLETVRGIFNLKTTDSLKWLKDVAKEKYIEGK